MNKMLKTILCTLALLISFGQGLFARDLNLNTKYQAVYVEGTNAHPSEGGKVPFVEFIAKDRIAGFAGDNLFNTSFDMRKDGSVRIGGIATTRMMGRNGAYERAFLAALSNTVKVDNTKGELVFLGKNGKPTMKFKMTQEAPKPALSLASTKWQVVFLEGAKKSFASMGDGRVPFVEFSSPDKINGFAGDNIFNGSYKLEKNGDLKIGDNMAVTMMMGINGEYEHAFLQALRRISKAEIKDAGMLCLFDKNGKLLMHLKPLAKSVKKGNAPKAVTPPPAGQRPVAPLTEEERMGRQRDKKLR